MKIATVILLFGMAVAGWQAKADDKWDISKLDVSKLPAAADKKPLTYAKDIRPLFEGSCLRCHGENRPKGDLRLDSLDALLKGGKDGKVVVPGQSKKSLLVIAAAQINEDTAMPPKRGMGGRGGPGGGFDLSAGAPFIVQLRTRRSPVAAICRMACDSQMA